MKVAIILSSLLAVVFARKSCYSETVNYCADKLSSLSNEICGARYGHVNHVKKDIQGYINLHFNASFNYLLMATNFGGYVRNREGMEKVLRHLSDSTWNDAIDLIKYSTKRGIPVNFDSDPENVEIAAPGNFKLNEIQSLGHALDSQKVIAQEALKIHLKASSSSRGDPEVASFLENNFLHRHADVIRNLAGLTSDLNAFLFKPEINTVSVFLFDEYLKKVM